MAVSTCLVTCSGRSQPKVGPGTAPSLASSLAFTWPGFPTSLAAEAPLPASPASPGEQVGGDVQSPSPSPLFSASPWRSAVRASFFALIVCRGSISVRRAAAASNASTGCHGWSCPWSSQCCLWAPLVANYNALQRVQALRAWGRVRR